MNNNFLISARYEKCSQSRNCVEFSHHSNPWNAFLPECNIKNKKAKASLTLEAAVSIPLFLMFCIALISFLVIINLQINIQVSMDETARSMGKKAYLLERAADGLDNDSSDSLDSSAQSLMQVGINPTTIKIWVLSTGKAGSAADSSRIIGGSGGLYTYASTYDQSEGILDIVLDYDYQIPWLPSYFGTLRFVQRMRSHVWTGKSLEEGSGGDDADSSGTVYVTPTGSVYHTSASCHYLDLSIHTVSYSTVSSERNASGARYERCSECASACEGGSVYITDYGTNWHASLGCSGLKRTVVETDISEVGDMRKCSKCAENE